MGFFFLGGWQHSCCCNSLLSTSGTIALINNTIFSAFQKKKSPTCQVNWWNCHLLKNFKKVSSSLPPTHPMSMLLFQSSFFLHLCHVVKSPPFIPPFASHRPSPPPIIVVIMSLFVWVYFLCVDKKKWKSVTFLRISIHTNWQSIKSLRIDKLYGLYGLLIYMDSQFV